MPTNDHARQKMWKTARRVAITLAILACLPFIALWVLLGMEGYPTPSAVRNFLIEDSQIRIDLPKGYKITDLQLSGDRPHSINIDGRSAIIRIGYTCVHIELTYTAPQGSGLIVFSEVKKLSPWHHLTFQAIPSADHAFDFKIDQNGVHRDASLYGIEQTTTPQATPPAPDKPSI